MPLSFNPENYLQAFRIGQQNKLTNEYQPLQGIENIAQTTGNIAEQARQRQLAQYNQRTNELKSYDPTLTPEANAARMAYLRTGQMPSSQPAQSPQPLQLANPSPTTPPSNQLADAGVSDTQSNNQILSSPLIPASGWQSSHTQNQQQPNQPSPILQSSSNQQTQTRPTGMMAMYEQVQPDYNAVIEGIKNGNYGPYNALSEKHKGDLKQLPAYENAIAEAKRKNEPLTSVDKALLMFPHLSGKEKQMRQFFPNGLTNEELNHFASGVKMDITGGEKSNQFYQKEWDKITKEANALTSSGRSPLGLATKADYNANRALKTINKSMVTNQDAGNAMADLASIYQNGTATQFGMSEQAYKTLYGKIQEGLQYITGKPRDAMTDDIKQHLIGIINDMKETNNDVIQQNLDYIETSQPDVISHFQNQWNGIRSKFKGGVSQGDQAGHSEIPAIGQSFQGSRVKAIRQIK